MGCHPGQESGQGASESPRRLIIRSIVCTGQRGNVCSGWTAAGPTGDHGQGKCRCRPASAAAKRQRAGRCWDTGSCRRTVPAPVPGAHSPGRNCGSLPSRPSLSRIQARVLTPPTSWRWTHGRRDKARPRRGVRVDGGRTCDRCWDGLAEGPTTTWMRRNRSTTNWMAAASITNHSRGDLRVRCVGDGGARTPQRTRTIVLAVRMRHFVDGRLTPSR